LNASDNANEDGPKKALYKYNLILKQIDYNNVYYLLCMTIGHIFISFQLQNT